MAGGMVVALVSMIGDATGALGSGSGLLMAVITISQLDEALREQHQFNILQKLSSFVRSAMLS
jgi:preprotein translocase subunit SecY